MLYYSHALAYDKFQDMCSKKAVRLPASKTFTTLKAPEN